MANLELYGTAGCPFTSEMREWLEWQGREFVEYDVEVDAAARARMQALEGGHRHEGDECLLRAGWLELDWRLHRG